MSVSLAKSAHNDLLHVSTWVRDWATADLRAQYERQYDLENAVYSAIGDCEDCAADNGQCSHLAELRDIQNTQGVLSLELLARDGYGTWFNLLRDPHWITETNTYGATVSVRARNYVNGK